MSVALILAMKRFGSGGTDFVRCSLLISIHRLNELPDLGNCHRFSNFFGASSVCPRICSRPDLNRLPPGVV